ncbi:NAD(P)-dependent oxidoreductase [Saccharomonospora cyanea]|uniref:Beta-hydroxyacid dehydrogenase, 3-hydroxyisobutyrate dehydrogenase n=1 Tax=Saccharomonospora cyanea NA-134 TaxID=882082 RepID=H5XF49_9PSEU|nr:NAD(P)-binding domain-containing protein [Saccharomonospora cyanea]EHR61459.1 beta-hydroxyacid dehydrogenase, 3-hydroxyisobutyrate dehydrogenase [Saccharomonospora cyanea NA-134]EHR62562.1 beta-hydroxyacid dehydrogenase, 3-hydroxyisobutyrate dehydrogenase [Saccharomonospora cyanea NA-134]
MTTTDGLTGVASQVTVLGLGDMGSAIAKVFVNRGYRTTVWNRTASKGAPLVEAGATAAATAAEAVAASPLVVVCLLDNTAVEQVLGSVDAAVAGRVLVNVTSGSPAQARSNERWASERGAEYLDGKIMGDPPYVGTPNIVFPFSGARRAFEAHESTLRVLGSVEYHGEDPGAAAVEFMAQVAVAYELLIGFLHALRLVQAEGVDVAEFAERVAGSLGAYPPLLTSFGQAVKNGEYGPDLGSLDVQAALMDDMISHRESMGVEAVRMREVKDLMDRRIADGHGDQGFSSLFEVITKRR